MRRPAPAHDHLHVDFPSVWPDIDLDARPIAGTALLPTGGRASPFVGWPGLTAALQALRSPRASTAGEEVG